jgi:hypothetical protein
MLENSQSKKLMKGEESSGGLIYPGGNGARNTGFEELSVTHPYSSYSATGVNPKSRFESDPYPRAIIERSIMYNADFCKPVAG